MRRGSLRRRLLALAILTIAAALVVAWVSLALIFERFVRMHVEGELAGSAVLIASNLTWEGDRPRLEPRLLDATFEQPMGGFYWQIEAPEVPPLRSRSLWDEVLPEPPGPPGRVPIAYVADSPQGRRLIIHAEHFLVPSPIGERPVTVLVGADFAEIAEPVGAFRDQMTIALVVIGVVLAAAAAIQLTIGLAPLAALQAEVAAVRSRSRSRLSDQVPVEVAPLVEEVNELLAAQEETIRRARMQAGDLAHGLKTPLTIIANLAPVLHASGHPCPAGEIEAQVQAMRRRIDRQLARARLGSGRFATSRFDILAERLVSLMQMTPHGASLEWLNQVGPGIVVPADEVDVAEILGNLLDNACKWAKSQVRIRASGGEIAVTVVVEDDGPGVPEEEFEAILKRGHKLAEEKDGSGLGLAIVDELVTAYGGTITLGRSEFGGLAATVSFPACVVEARP